MTTRRFSIAVSLLAALFVAALRSAAAAAPPPLGMTLPAKCVDVYDGDTLTLDVTLRVRVRLSDCWAPEVRGGTLKSRDAGAASEKHLRELALGQPAVLFVPFAGARTIGHLFSFERVVGKVWVYDVDLSEAQVKAGHASTNRNGRLGE